MPKEDPFVNRAQLLRAIKKYPEIWDSNNKLHMCRSVTAPMWNEIAEQFGGHVPTVKLQSIWSQMKYHYHNLVHRQILHKDRFTTKWEHFEPMSFMYNITVAKIVGSTNSTSAAASSAGEPSQGRGRPGGGFGWMSAAMGHDDVAAAAAAGMDAYPGFSGLVPPAAITVEATTTPSTLTTTLRRPGRPGSLNNGMRARIIDAIRERPLLWAGRRKDRPGPGQGQGQGPSHAGQSRSSAVWKELAAELGLSANLVQTRWSIIKQRYVDELQKERHCLYQQLPFHSTWEHFGRMSFMREILLRKVDDREQTRERIQEIVSEKHGLPPAAPRPLGHLRPGLVGTLIAPHHLLCGDDDATHAGGGGGGRRGRAKAPEPDMEWDPFEMILHVHDAEGGAN